MDVNNPLKMVSIAIDPYPFLANGPMAQCCDVRWWDFFSKVTTGHVIERDSDLMNILMDIGTSHFLDFFWYGTYCNILQHNIATYCNNTWIPFSSWRLWLARLVWKIGKDVMDQAANTVDKHSDTLCVSFGCHRISRGFMIYVWFINPINKPIDNPY